MYNRAFARNAPESFLTSTVCLGFFKKQSVSLSIKLFQRGELQRKQRPDTSNTISELSSSEWQSLLSALRKPFKELLAFKLLKPGKGEKIKLEVNRHLQIQMC